MSIQKNVELAPFTTWKIGGKARYFVVVKNAEEVKEVLEFAKSKSIPFFILGGGSNILVSDKGFDGLVIKMELEGINFFTSPGDGEELKERSNHDEEPTSPNLRSPSPSLGEENIVTAGAGVMMSRLAAEALQKGFSGLQWAIGLPGTVGGAVFGNSNCWGGSTGKSLHSAKLLSSSPNLSRQRRGVQTGRGEVKEADKEYFNFSYDYSILQDTKEVLLEATFSLEKLDVAKTEIAREDLAKLAAERSARQPLGKNVAGSTFKALMSSKENIKKITNGGFNYKQGLRDGYISAGWIIDKVLNLKGFEMGNMKISDLHANFFINAGGANAREAKNLIDFVKEECENKVGIKLEEEIKYVGEFG